MKNNINFLIAIGMLMLVSLACSASFTTANLSELKFGKNEKANPASESFKPADKIFVVSEVNNTSDKHSVKFRLLFDDVKGQKAGAMVPGAETTIEAPGSSDVHFSVALPGGFPPGTYKAEAVLFDADGKKEIDRKEGTFTVAGGSAKKFESEDDEDSAAKSFAANGNANSNSNTDAATRVVTPGIRTSTPSAKPN
ncbi:MAG TPA: hypothetical protein VF571_02790 [Pyrinomonadaceae bacterium]|jgi:hypothetical protein